jgi:hypothetical protein
MAPSFTLFNQSFDSFANDGHLPFNADSFGFGRTESSAAMEGILRHTASSSGLPPGQIGGGGGSFAYSPVHSFDAVLHNNSSHGNNTHHHHHPPMLLPPPPQQPTTQVLYRRPFSPMMPPTFYSFLGKFKEAFQGCTFLLPGLKTTVIDTKTTTATITTSAVELLSKTVGVDDDDDETPDVATVRSVMCIYDIRIEQFVVVSHQSQFLSLL